MRKLARQNETTRKIINIIPWLLAGPLFYALFRLSFLWPDFTENVYSRGIFSFISQCLSTATGLLPISLGELLLYLFILFVIIFIIIMIIRSVTAGKGWWKVLAVRTGVLLSVASCVYALFIGIWGFNYARSPLGDTLNLDTSPASVGELYSACEALIARANELRAEVPEDADGIFAPAYSKYDMMTKTPSYYNEAADLTGLSFLGGSFGRVKPVIYSTGLSYANITGVYFPFTAEPNINADVPMLFFASSCLHEAAHQRGFAREDEANFLAFYVSAFSGDASVEYSGTMLALVIAMNNLYGADSDLYFELRAEYSEGIDRDLNNNSQYWQQFESPVNETARAVNNSFLQANMQSDGVKSYGRMTDLIIALWRNGEL